MGVDMMFKLCVLILGSVACTFAAVAIYPYEPKPAEFADQEGCYIRDLNRVLPYEEPYYPRDGKSCVQYTCSRTNNETQLVSCGAIGFPDNCHLERDLTLDYPKCCGTVVCDPTTTTTTTDTPTTTSTEATCITVTPPPCERPSPRKPKYTLPVEKPLVS